MSPRPETAQLRRPEILSAAMEVIRERGVSATRIADIAERIGTSPPSVLYYFESKQELLHEALTYAEEQFYEELDGELTRIPSARDRLVWLVESTLASGDLDAVLWIELWPQALRNEELAATRRTLDRRWRGAIASIIRDGQQRGEFGGGDPDELALLAASLMDGLAIQVALEDHELTSRRRRREMSHNGEAIRFDDVTKQFGSTTAVDDLSLSIRRGEFFSLLGPSGCGKTTTLRMVAGFEQPTEGSVYLDGEPVGDVPPYRRNVNTVFQSYALFEHLDVEGNVAFGLKRRKVDGEEIKTRVAEALELVQLTGRERSKPRQLSGGQMQRVALARALVNRPSVLLLDEPLGALDLKLRKQMQVELKEIQREVGITFLYVTHDQEEALAMSDRIAVMDEGVVQQIGPPEEIYETPRKTFVAGFIGVSNLLPATVEGEGVRLSTGQLCQAALPEGAKQGDSVHCSVRPEKIFLDDLEDGMVSVEGEIVERIYMGTTTQVIIELAPDVRVISLEQNTARSRADDRWEIGERVRLGWHPEHPLVLR